MSNPDTVIHTNAPRQLLSRLTMYRLKRAKADYLLAVAEQEDQYNERVRAILGNDRASTVALRNQEAGNWKYWPWQLKAARHGQPVKRPAPSIAHTHENELTPYPGTPKPWWFTNIGRSLLMRHGYKPAGAARLER